jgi:hypothetical protein
MLRKILSLLKIQPRSVYRIEAMTDGLRCSGSEEGAYIIKWGSIQKIEGFKRDQVTTDLICLAITYYDEAEKFIEINEEMQGFNEAVEELERLNFLKPNWSGNLQPFQSHMFTLFQLHDY